MQEETCPVYSQMTMLPIQTVCLCFATYYSMSHRTAYSMHACNTNAISHNPLSIPVSILLQLFQLLTNIKEVF